ncbi:NifB/NifX family molybdenum-iron cluster-binding protein [Parablautia sp. Marseille-Q6255]|uniref:NifB/NifX family molybdenum-iron cluster-binding protein n=1 Tax=Parablautia sp. Marseille-Q6255 TaxID=3039593 RepID=UPI0024BD28B6|nr:NifB/NifX family molybdenum-iron cluster-binding protein [Parablautia sp. Marseille-Q6255]
MKIAIPMEEKSINTNICVTFGRALFFLIFDTDTEEEKYIENPALSAQGGAGIKAAQAVIDAGVEAVILPRLGQNAAEVFQTGQIVLYKAEFGSAKHNIELLKECKLSKLTEFHSGFHGRGGR